MKIITLISRLLDYPTTDIAENATDIVQFIEQSDEIAQSEKHLLLNFVEERLAHDLLDWQAEYDSLFERGRSLSLLIYEHIHGESRDRGQAMVDLAAQYKLAGLDIGVRELPDYIPLFLEFVATQGEQNARDWLNDIAPVIALLAVRLEKRQNLYANLFWTLLELSRAHVDLTALREQVASEKRDDTKKALDKVWEEEAITFGGDAINGGCPSSTNRPSESQRRDQDVPIQFFNPETESKNQPTNQEFVRN